MGYTVMQREQLHQIARGSIEHGLSYQRALPVDFSQYDKDLQQHRACFVTLHEGSALRGCIGNLTASNPLVRAVSDNAFAAAFRDPRFSPLTRAELENLVLTISVLSESERIAFSSESELIAQLRPGIDGLILEANGHRGTFLPAVWEQLPEPAAFLRQLKLKAGLAADYWSDSVTVSRYHSETF